MYLEVVPAPTNIGLGEAADSLTYSEWSCHEERREAAIVFAKVLRAEYWVLFADERNLQVGTCRLQEPDTSDNHCMQADGPFSAAAISGEFWLHFRRGIGEELKERQLGQINQMLHHFCTSGPQYLRIAAAWISFHVSALGRSSYYESVTVLTGPLKLYLPHQNQLMVTITRRPPTATIE